MNALCYSYGLLAAVVYKLKVTLDLNGLFSQDLHAKIPLCIHSKLTQNVGPAMQELTKPVTVCCCIDKGTCHVKGVLSCFHATCAHSATANSLCV